MTPARIIIIGAGQAGFSIASKLRSLDFDGSIKLIGAEDQPPYQRPPLSKKYLLGEMEREQLFLKPEDFYTKNNIDLLTGTEVEKISQEARTVTANGKTFQYDHLAFATGSQAIPFPHSLGGNLEGVHQVRDLRDIEDLKQGFRAGRKVLIIGGGYIGLEAAAVAQEKGLHVTLVEMADRILQRVACPETSDFFRNLHREKGVNILEGIGVEILQGDQHVSSAKLSNGETLDVDFVIVGIGIKPAIKLAEISGLDIENGIKVNEYGQSSDTNIWGAGDCASFPHQGERIRLESVPHAIAHGECVATNIVASLNDDEMQIYTAKPWFWSDQYDVKLQIAGLNSGYDRIEIKEGSRPGGQSHHYFKKDQLIAVDAMNDPKAYMLGKREIESR